jgi:hypothetical protein
MSSLSGRYEKRLPRTNLVRLNDETNINHREQHQKRRLRFSRYIFGFYFFFFYKETRFLDRSRFRRIRRNAAR